MAHLVTPLSELVPSEIPLIIVAGRLRCGKSMVIESIVGRRFLSSDSDVNAHVNYSRPLVIRLHCVPEEYEERAELLRQTYHDFDSLAHDIALEKRNQVRGFRGLTIPILIDLYLHAAKEMSIVELPGICPMSFPCSPTDTELYSETMTSTYIADPRPFVINVVSANNDVFSSRVLHYSLHRDPQAQGMLMALTKVDLMDRGTDAIDLLSGGSIIGDKEFQIVGLVNRSQDDVRNNMSLEDAWDKERSFFRSDPYSAVAQRQGAHHLRELVNQFAESVNINLT